jgi:Ca-activated chloride channel homolog
MSLVSTLIALVFGFSALATFASAEAADKGAGAGPQRVTEGTLLWRTAAETMLSPAPVLRTDVEMLVTGMVVRVAVRQEFANPAATWAEAIYVFPLPEDAAVDHLHMRIGERVIEGVVEEREAAKASYEQAKREGRRASLIEEERANIFTTSVANIPPGAAITVEIEYQHVAQYDTGRFKLRFPMVVGPRYIPGDSAAAAPAGGSGWASDTNRVSDASRITPPVRHPSRGPINPVALTVELDAGMPIARVESAYHPIRTTPLGGGRYRVELADGAVPADRDFELVWTPTPGAAPAAALFTERAGDAVFALLMVMPPAAGSPGSERGPREAIFVIDVSGSMAGASIDQARVALSLALARLGPADTFNVIRFNHKTDALFETARPATRDNLRLADAYVAALRADGGTEMLPALRRALDGRESPGRLRQVVFLTDGGVGNEAELFKEIGERLGTSRLFTIGIGSAPNSHFMREAARLGRGTFTFIGSPTEVQAKMTALFRKLESPALTDVAVDLPGGAAADLLPSQVPDLYLGEPLMVALKSRALPASVTLRGTLGGAPWETEVPLREVAEDAGVAVHWARAKIGALLDTRRSGAPDDDVRRAVIELALDHHLVSQYTSLVALDVTPARPAGEGLESHALETNLPDGWDYTTVFGLGQGATAAPLHLALGLSALALAGLAFAWAGRGAPVVVMRRARGAGR